MTTMTFKKYKKKGLGLAVFLIGLIASGFAHAGFSTTELQLLYGDGYRMGSNATFPDFPQKTQRSTITLDHFSTNDLGDLFIFFDFFVDKNNAPIKGQTESDIYGELYYHIHSKHFGLNLGDGFVKALDFGVGLNQGTNFSVSLMGPRVSFNMPGFLVLSLSLSTYNNFIDIMDRNLKSTYQASLVWDAPFNIGNQKFQIKGFADFIGDQGSEVVKQVLFSPQFKWDMGHAMGCSTDKIHLGFEYTHFKNTFGVAGVDENSIAILLGLKF